MTYRKAMEKQGYQNSSSRGSDDQPSAGSSASADDDGTPGASNAVRDGGGGDDSGSHGSALDVSVDVGVGLDTNSLAPQGLGLPEFSVLPLPILSDVLAGGEHGGDCDDGTDTAAADDPACAQADISINAHLFLEGGNTGTDVLTAVLNGTPLLGDSSQCDGLLTAAILDGCGTAESGEGVSVDPQLLPAIDGVLDGLVGSVDLFHLFDGGGCNT